MSMYWIYDIPTWQLGVLTVAAFVGGSLTGLFVTRPLTRRLLAASAQYNDLVSYFVSAVGVFYGLALGLIAVATWEDLNDVDSQVSKEAASLAALYRDFDGYPQPFRGQLEDQLRDYTRTIIQQDWPAHRHGETSAAGTERLDALENQIMAFEPKTEREKIAHAAVIKSLDAAVEEHRIRLGSVDTGLPASLWVVVLIGAALNLVLTYFFWVDNRALHAILVALLATFIALLIFLTAAMDNPFRGEFSVSADAYQMVLDQVMAPKTGS